MKNFFEKVKGKFLTFFFIDEGGKRIINGKRFKYTAAFTATLLTVIQLLWPTDHSELAKSYKPFVDKPSTPQLSVGQKPQEVSGIRIPSKEDVESSERPQGRKSNLLPKPIQLVYRGKQVLERSGTEGTLASLPSGTNFIGKLVNGIDTRESNQVAKVMLPYGTKHPNGGSLPKNAILLGVVSHSGESEKIFIRFNRIIFPNGSEYKIDAQALNSADYSPGLAGVNHSNSDIRMASSIGLTMVSAATDVLTQRSMVNGLNPYGMAIPQPDATAQNAMLQGVSQVTKQEAQRQAQDLQKAQEYVTVYSDSDLIISLLSPFNGEPI